MERLWSEGALYRAMTLAEHNSEYQKKLEMVKRKEIAYHKVVEQLSVQERETVEDYIATCEALEEVFAWLAYRVGKEEGAAPK